MQPEFLFRVVDGKWVWKEANGKQVIMNFLRKYNNKKRWIKCIFKVVRQPKTPEQLGYYYTAILPTIHRQLVDDGHTMTVCNAELLIDEKTADKVIKHYCSRVANNGTVLLYKDYPKGSILKKRDMTKQQAMMFLDNCIFWAKEVLHCVIPEPDTNWRKNGAAAK